MTRHYTTKQQDREFLMRRMEDLSREWKVGDTTLPYKTCNPPTTVVRFEGDTVHLADGTAMHRSHLQKPENRIDRILGRKRG